MRERVQDEARETRDSSPTPDAPVPRVHHVLVLPDRDSAEEIAEELSETLALPGEPQLVRDALAGEDDAEDAQWLVVIEDHDGVCDLAALDQLAVSHEGWLERD